MGTFSASVFLKKSVGEDRGRFILLTTAVSAILCARLPWLLTRPTLLFEDGTTFFADQLVYQSPLKVFHPFCHGYYGDCFVVWIPRLAALTALYLPAVFAPAIFNLTGIFASAVSLSLFSLNRFRRALPSDWLRILTVLVCAASSNRGEWLATATNSFWVVTIAVALLSFSPPLDSPEKSILRKLLSFSGAALVAAATPLSVLVLPVLAYLLIVKRIAQQSSFAVGLTFGVFLELAVRFAYSGPAVEQVHTVTDITAMASSFTAAICYQIVLPALAGTAIARESVDASNPALTVLLIISTCGFFTAVFRLLPRTERLRLLLPVYFASASILLALHSRHLWKSFSLVPLQTGFDGSRYFFIASCMFVYSIMLAINLWMTRRGHQDLIRPTIATIMVFGFAGIADFRLDDYERGTAPNWQDVAPFIDSWKRAIAVNADTADINLPIFKPPVWAVYLPSNALAGGDFENYVDTSLWYTNWKASAEIVNSAAFSGARSLQLTGISGGELNKQLFVPASTSAEVSMQIMAECEAIGGYRTINVSVFDEAQKILDSKRIHLRCRRWQPVSLFISPATYGRRALLRLKLGRLISRLYADQLRMVRAAESSLPNNN